MQTMSKLLVNDINYTFVLSRLSQIYFYSNGAYNSTTTKETHLNDYHIFSVVWLKLLAD